MFRLIKLARIEFVAVPVLIWMVGCSSQSAREAARQPRSAAKNNLKQLGMAFESYAADDSGSMAVDGRLANYQTAPIDPKKIIYEAQISLVVKSFSETEAQIAKLLKDAGGYIADAAVNRTEGEQLAGRWQVRVPAAEFDSFLEAVSKLGVAENRRQTAQDVTEQFVDLEAQVASKKQLEERILAILQESSGQVKDVLEVERELARVRGEIEQMEGRLRYLTNRTDMTTVTIAAREVEDYVPPAVLTLGNRIVQAWNSSLTALRMFGERTLVALVYAGPWLIVLCLLITPTVWYARRRAAVSKRAA